MTHRAFLFRRSANLTRFFVLGSSRFSQVLNVERAIWTTERSNLTLIHHTLEEEMDAVARELIDYNRPELS